jgi:hypothetical protein
MRHLVASQRLLLRSLCLAVLLSSIPGRLVAGTGWAPIDPKELAMKSEPLAPGAAAIILYRQVDRDDNGSTSHEFNYVRIKILSEEGRKHADIEIPFVKDVNDVVQLKARTIRPDGSVVNFEGKAFEKSIVKAKGVKYLAKTFTLPDVQVGGIIEYSFAYDYPEHWIYDSHWILSDELFTKHAKFSLRPYSSPYQRFSVRWAWQGLPPGTAQPKEDPDHVIRLEAFNIPPFQTEDFMPPENELKSRVDFIYSDDAVDKDADAYWKKVDKRLYDSVESWIGKRSSFEQAASQIVAPGDAPEVKLQRIYTRVQQMRNTSFEREKSAQEEKRAKEKDANNATDVWKRGQGNGAQLTWLFLGLARAAGFDAHGIMVSDRAHYFFNPKLQDSSRLNSNVVQVNLNGKDLYCDPGSKFASFGLLPWAETGVQGLRLDKDTATWVRTPVPEASVSRVERTAQLKLSDTGDLEGKLTLKYTGLEALVRRSEERNEDEAERKKFLEDQVEEYIPTGSNVELTNHPVWDNPASDLVAEFNLKVPGWVSSAARRVLFPAALFGGQEKHVFEHGDRTHPIYFEFPFQRIDDITVELPAGWKMTSLPAPDKQGNQAIAYNLKLEDDKGKLHIMRTLSIGVLLMDAKYYSALRDFYQVVRTGDEQQIVLQPGTATASN